MIITCEACGTSFKVKSSLIKDSGSTVRCSKCQHVFISYPPAAGEGGPADFRSDETLEAKIDDVLGTEFDDELESEISLETAEIPAATEDELFESAATRRKDREVKADESEILMSDLEQEEDVISMDALVSGATADENLEEWLAAPESDAEVISFGELGAKSTVEDLSEDVSFDESGRKEPEIAFDDLESTAEHEMVDLGALESGEPAATRTAEATSEEEEVDFLDFEDEEAAGQATAEAAEGEIEMALEDNLQETAEIPEAEAEAGEVEFETKGGVDKDLDAFDLEKGSGDDTSKGTAKKAGKEPKAQEPAQDTSKKETEEEEFELDFDLEEEPEAPAEASKATAEEESFDFDLDLEEETAATSKTAEALEDLDLETGAGEKEAALTDDLGLDLDGFEDLDLTEEPAAAEVSSADLDLDLDLDLGGATEERESAAAADALDLDLDLDKELADIDAGTIAEEDFSLDFDLEEKAEKPAKAKTVVEEAFDLDFDLESEGAKAEAAAEEDFELDLNIEPEPVKAEAQADDFDLDLDFGEDVEEKAPKAAEKSPRRKTEELDLTQIEDVLDFDEMPAPKKAAPKEEIKDLGMEEVPFTVSEDEEMSIDLETMLDDEGPEEKEVSLETVEEREKEIEKTYRKTVVEKQKGFEDAGEEIPDEEEESYLDRTRTMEKPAAPMGMAQEEGRNLKKVLVPLVILIVLGVLAVAGWMLFGGKEEAPPPPVKPAVTDQGNLRMEMIAEPAYQFVENQTAGELLVVTGTVTNRYDHPRSNIEVKAALYDNAGKVIVTSSAFAGNMFTDAELASLDAGALRAGLNNRTGDENANVGVAPGKTIPFTVIFTGLPVDINEYELTVESVRSAK